MNTIIPRWTGVWLVLTLCMGSSLGAQNPRVANDLLRQGQEERYTRMQAQWEDMQLENLSLRRRIESLEKDLRLLKRDTHRHGGDEVSPNDLTSLSKELTDRIKTVDEKRASDSQTILSKIQQILDMVRKIEDRPATLPSPSETEKILAHGVHEHTVEPGETISTIAEAYRREAGLKVSINDILTANPGIEPKKIRPGDVILIPRIE